MFPLVACAPCAGERLAFIDLVGEALVHICAYCGQAAPFSRHVDDSVLSAQGLRVREATPIESLQPKKTGCSKGSCGTGGGCSTGSCSTCKSC
jgi:hypothetical protein